MDYAIIAPDGTVIMTANTRAGVVRLANTSPRFTGTVCRWVFGTWAPID